LRFLDDLKKQKKDDFPYLFVESRAERFFVWMQLFKHTKGPLAGTIKKPELIEKFLFGQIYGWVFKDTRYRRFRNVYYQVARKNAKSQDLAILGTFELSAFGESCSEVIIAATKKSQTKYVWNEADLILRRCELLKNKFKTTYGVINHIKSDSTMTRMSEEDKTKDDGSNPQCGIIDEYHAHKTQEYYDVLSSGMKTRTQPLLIIITTAGFDLNNPCYRDEYDYISKILNPDNPIENDRYLSLVCELDKDIEGNLLDDIKDEKVWIKSNPILCNNNVGMESIKAELKIALDKPEKLRDFLTKTMNIWVSMRESGYIDLEKWNACKDDIPDLAKEECYIGIDLSAKIDLTSVTFEFPFDEKYIVLSHSFMPEETFENKMKTDKVPYNLWVKYGWITLTRGASVDYRDVKDYFIKKCKENKWLINSICIDPWGSAQISNDLIDEGHNVIEIIQGIKTLSEPTKDFRDMVAMKRIIHDGNPVLSWAIGNAIVDKVDRNENIILNKKKSGERIDPIAATINSHVRCMVHVENSGAGMYFA